MAKRSWNTAKYKKSFADRIIQLGKEGKYISQVAADFGVTRQALYQWSIDSNKPEFVEAWGLYRTYLQNWWIDLGVRGMTGQIPKFLYIQWMYMMKCIFREEWLSDQKQVVDVTGDAIKTMTDDQLESLAMTKVQERIKKLKAVK